MDRDAAIEWVNTLKSGNYKQGFDRLRDMNFFCCLGVFLDIHIGKHEKNQVIKEYWKTHGIYRGETETLPRYIMNHYQFNDELIASVKIGEKYSSSTEKCMIDHLADANDVGVEFADIAKWIEQHYEKI